MTEQKKEESMQRPPGGISLFRLILFALIAYFILQWGFGLFDQRTKIPYTTFRQHVQKGQVAKVVVRGDRIQGELENQAELVIAQGDTVDYKQFVTFFPTFGDEKLMSMLEENEVTITTQPESDSNWWYILIFLAPILLIGAMF